MTAFEVVFIVSLAIVSSSYAFAPSSFGCKWVRYNNAAVKSSSDDRFDGKEFEEALKNISPTMGKTINADDKDSIINDIRTEQISRKYPFDDYTEQLPILPDCNNYYSGKYGTYTWHQNADQVFVYIPVEDTIGKRDIEIKFEALSVKVVINDEVIAKFDTIERLIPDGSFWIFETDKNGQKYIQLDMEKRYRMINWKNLFGEAPKVVEGEAEARREMLEKLFAANKGMSKMTGQEPESMDEMLKNENLMKMIKEINSKPELIEDSEGGTEVLEEGQYEDEEADEGDEENVIEIDAPFDIKNFVSKTADKYYSPKDPTDDSNSEIIDITEETPKE
jgi:hypothetical protein